MTVTGVLMFGLSEALASSFIRMFGYSEELYQMALRGFRIYAIVFVTVGFNIYGSSLFTSLNNGLVSALVSFLRTIAFQVTAVMVLPLFWGLDGVWSAGVFSDILSLIVTAVFVIVLHKRYGYYGKIEEPLSAPAAGTENV